MCGLAVSVRRKHPIDVKRLKAAIGQLGHRGPDASGLEIKRIYGDQGELLVEAGFAHARLSILDLDPRSNQPFSIDGNMLVYNGEVYNFKSLAKDMELTTSGDTEVFLRLLMRDDPTLLSQLNGMWAYCWLDRDNRKLIAGRDRYGKKPLFYAIEPDTIHFASEPHSLATLLGRPLAMESDALDSYMVDGWLFPDPSGKTHLEGIREVRPGHRLHIDIQSWTVEEHDTFAFSHSHRVKAPDLDVASLASVFSDAVEARLVSDRKVGLFLSGGVDSSLILSALASKGLMEDVVCITGDAGKSDDMVYAKACVDQLGIEALRIALPYGSLGFDQFLDVCKVQAKPFPMIGNVLGMHALYKSVSEHDIRVVLDGSGADEIFGGYWQRYFAFALRDASETGDTGWIESVRPPSSKVNMSKDYLSEWMPSREHLTADELAILRPEIRSDIAAKPARDPLINFKGSLSAALLRDATSGRMQEWLWQNDRNAMASSIENRSPFLDYRLAAWTATSHDRKFNAEWNKRELRDLFQHFVPLPTVHRVEKQGFRWAYSVFFRENLEPILAMIAGSKMVERYVNHSIFIDAVRSGKILLSSHLLHRLTVIAGLEATGLGFKRSGKTI